MRKACFLTTAALALMLVLLVLAGAAGAAGGFVSRTDYPTGAGTEDITVGDFNHDGITDMAVADWDGNSISVFLGTGGGAFAARTDYPAGLLPATIKAADLNGDGNLDLVTSNDTGGSVSVFLGNGTGSFGTRTDYPAGARAVALAVGDLNSDGVPDLVVGNLDSGHLTLLFGNGAGGFSAPVTRASAGSYYVALADVNHDGKLDVAVANWGGSDPAGTVSVYLGDGAGSLGSRTDYPTGGGAVWVALRDLNGDGNVDMVSTDVGENDVSVRLGSGDGTFGPRTTYATGSSPGWAVLLDTNRDGTLDLVVPNYNDNTISTLLGDGTGGFGPKTDTATPASPWVAAAADLNGDGATDLMVGNYGASSVSVFLTDALPPAVTVPASVFQQAAGPGGATVTFSATASDNVDGALTPVCSSASGSLFPLGTTTVTCTATDAAGNTGSASFTVTVSVVAVTSAPPATSTSQQASFAWTALAFTRYTCSLDGAAYAACSAPRTYNGLAAGSHTFCVMATSDVQPQCTAWTIVSPGKPVPSILGVSVAGTAATATFTADQTASRFTCSLDGAAYKSCTSGLTYHGLAVGPHTLRVLATNFAGDTSAAPAVASFTV